MTEETQPDNYHTYDSNPVPWWLATIWVLYFIFGVTYLVVNLLAG